MMIQPHRLCAAVLFLFSLSMRSEPASAAEGSCAAPASSACYFSFTPASGRLALHYYASMEPPAQPAPSGPTQALIAIHGHPRDANKTFDAAWRAVQAAKATDKTLVVAPVFQVSEAQSSTCSTGGVPAAAANDLLWTCASWLDGSPSGKDGITSFAAMDALVAELVQRWPSLRSVTLAGFSAGAQMVQHYIGFAAADHVGGASVRYVVSDPGTWLYFDAFRPDPPSAPCPAFNRWKYGTDALPATLGRSAMDARARYAAADVSYLEGELDSGTAPGTFYKIMDKSCSAMAQGPYRLQRGLAYAEYDRTMLAPGKNRRVTIVPDCAHDVACVFPSPAAREALLGPSR